jgi:hypothetical protein
MRVWVREEESALVVITKMLVNGVLIDGGNRKEEKVTLLECSTVRHIYCQLVDERTSVIKNRNSTKSNTVILSVLIQKS